MRTFAHERPFSHLILRPRIYQETRKPLFVWHVLPQGHYVIWPAPFRHFPLAHLPKIYQNVWLITRMNWKRC